MQWYKIYLCLWYTTTLWTIKNYCGTELGNVAPVERKLGWICTVQIEILLSCVLNFDEDSITHGLLLVLTGQMCGVQNYPPSPKPTLVLRIFQSSSMTNAKVRTTKDRSREMLGQDCSRRNNLRGQISTEMILQFHPELIRGQDHLYVCWFLQIRLWCGTDSNENQFRWS